MESKVTALFQSMYKILKNIWGQTQNEQLGFYLSDANPFLCLDGISMDPSVFAKFENMFNEIKADSMSDYEFIIYYLEHLEEIYGDIKTFFVQIPKEECILMLNELMSFK